MQSLRLKFFVIALMVMVSFVSFAQTGESGGRIQMDLLTYCRSVVEQSDQIKQAQANLERAEEAYDTALLEGAAALDIKAALVAAETARRASAEQEATVVIQAVTTYFSLLARERDLATARDSLEIEKKKLDAQQARFGQGLVKESDYLSQKSSLISAQKASFQAETAYQKAKWDFCKAIGVDMDSDVTLMDVPGLYSQKPTSKTQTVKESVQKARAASSTYYDAVESLKIAEEKWKIYQERDLGTLDERDQAEEDADSAVRTLYQTETQIEYDIKGLYNDYAVLLLDIELAENQLAVSRQQLEVAKKLYDQGSSYQTDVDQRKLSVKQNEFRVMQLLENTLTHNLTFAMDTGLKPLDEIYRFIRQQ